MSPEEFYRRHGRYPEARASYPNAFSEFIATNPVSGLLTPWAERALMSKDAPLQKDPSGLDLGLSIFDAATPAIPFGLLAGRVKKAAEKPITNIGQWLIKVRTKGPNWLSHRAVKEAAKKVDLPGSPLGQSISSKSLAAADEAIASGKTDDFIVAPKYGAEKPLSDSHFTPLGYRRNTPLQRKYLKTIRTRGNPEGFDVDSLSDDRVAQLVSHRHGWVKNPAVYNRYMALIDEDIGPYLGGRGLSITTNPDLQRAVSEMDVSSIEAAVSKQAHDYIGRQGLISTDIPSAQWNQLKDIIRNNLLLRRERLKPSNAAPLWKLNEPQLVIQTHHGKPTGGGIGGSVKDPRNIWAASGSSVQGGTHGLLHEVGSEVDPFYRSLRSQYYSPYYEEAIKSQKRGLEPHSGFLDRLQGLDPDLWDYNMRRAYEMFRRKKM
jgi:hypothetical protein